MCVHACLYVCVCICASRQMAQVQFTADSQLRLMYLEADCLQVAIKGVELPLLLDFQSEEITSSICLNGSPHTAYSVLALSAGQVSVLSRADKEGCAPLYPVHTPSALITITIKR